LTPRMVQALLCTEDWHLVKMYNKIECWRRLGFPWKRNDI